jgi:hypothetical protein
MGILTHSDTRSREADTGDYMGVNKANGIICYAVFSRTSTLVLYVSMEIRSKSIP